VKVHRYPLLSLANIPEDLGQESVIDLTYPLSLLETYADTDQEEAEVGYTVQRADGCLIPIDIAVEEGRMSAQAGRSQMMVHLFGHSGLSMAPRVGEGRFLSATEEFGWLPATWQKRTGTRSEAQGASTIDPRTDPRKIH
jgi:hypothetical protein